jgi:hypothetical protein
MPKLDCLNFLEPLWYGRSWPWSQYRIEMLGEKTLLDVQITTVLVDLGGIK